MEEIKKLLRENGFTDEMIEDWLSSPIPALSENYSLDVSPQQLIDDGKEWIVINLINETRSGFCL